MKTLRALTLVAATFALVSIFAAQARAELIVDISVSSSLVTGSGFFEFDAPTGNFIDNLVDWEFTGEAFGHDFVFDDPFFFISGTYTSDEDWN